MVVELKAALRATGFFAWLVLWPLAAVGDPFEAPELGVRFPELPAGATTPEVIDELYAYVVRLQVGPAWVNVLRLSDPVPAGANVADRAYRRRLDEYLHSPGVVNPTEGPSSVAGQSAWTTCSYWRQPGFAVNYTCISYLIFEQHLYRLMAHAEGPEQRPPEFDEAVRALSHIALGPAHPPMATDGAPLTSPRREPEVVSLPREVFYPAKAMRLNEEGAVDVEFSIDGKGRTRDLKADPPSGDLAKAAVTAVAPLRFKISSEWSAHPSSQRFTFEVHFHLRAFGAPCPQAKPRAPGNQALTICGVRLSGP